MKKISDYLYFIYYPENINLVIKNSKRDRPVMGTLFLILILNMMKVCDIIISILL